MSSLIVNSVQATLSYFTSSYPRHQLKRHLSHTKSAVAPSWNPRPTLKSTKSSPSVWLQGLAETQFVAKKHPLQDSVVEATHDFFLTHWPFPDEKSREKYVASDLAGAMCYVWPNADNDRIFLVCRLFTLLFLVDDQLEDMTFEEGRIYNDKLLALMYGHQEPDRDVPAEWITYDVWKEMRAWDHDMAHESLHYMAAFMRAQTSTIRLKKDITLHEYLDWRIDDIGAPLVTIMGCFASGLSVPAKDRELLSSLDDNWARHIVFLNDVWSYDKELAKAQNSDGEGSVLCNSVTIMAAEVGVTIDIAKRLMMGIIRELEVEHKRLAMLLLEERDTPEIREYIQHLEWQMSGNEVWHKETLRYKLSIE